MADVLDTDDPVLRGVLARLCFTLAAGLTKTGDDLAGPASASPWQAIAVAARLNRLREDIDFLRRDVGRLVPAAEE